MDNWPMFEVAILGGIIIGTIINLVVIWEIDMVIAIAKVVTSLGLALFIAIIVGEKFPGLHPVVIVAIAIAVYTAVYKGLKEL